MREAGAVAGGAEAREHARRAERNVPVLNTHDRYGNRIDAVELDPSWHWLLRGAVERGMSGLPWRESRQGAHVVRAAMFTLWGQLDDGVMCPVSMTYAAVPALRDGSADLAAEWEPRLTAYDYERGALAGMAMTERQGGSDVRANITRALDAGTGGTSCTVTSGSAPTRRATSSWCSLKRRQDSPASSWSAEPAWSSSA